jgi:riboflavin kinase/FMN adenylyltransferase
MTLDRGCGLALGLFDSIHTGHRYLINSAQAYCAAHNLDFLLLTFDDGFFDYIQKKEKSVYTLRERTALMNGLGISYSVIPSSKEFFMLNDKGFYDYLSRFNPKALFMGEDYTFGAKGKWTPKDMQAHFGKLGIEVFVVNLLKEGEEKVSTSLIKQMLESGNIDMANKLLGDDYFIMGKVVSGKGIGHTMGLPTANMEIADNKFLPKWGVYATYADVMGKRYKAITNIGGQPTFGQEKPCVESYLLDFGEDIYNRDIQISIKAYLRDIKRFESPELLKQQILSDIKKAESTW